MHPGRAVDGAARRKRRQTYPELERACRCRLVVVGVEVGGRFGAEAANWLRLLAKRRAADVPAALRTAALCKGSAVVQLARGCGAARIGRLPAGAPARAGECNVAAWG